MEKTDHHLRSLSYFLFFYLIFSVNDRVRFLLLSLLLLLSALVNQDE